MGQGALNSTEISVRKIDLIHRAFYWKPRRRLTTGDYCYYVLTVGKAKDGKEQCTEEVKERRVTQDGPLEVQLSPRALSLTIVVWRGPVSLSWFLSYTGNPPSLWILCIQIQSSRNRNSSETKCDCIEHVYFFFLPLFSGQCIIGNLVMI